MHFNKFQRVKELLDSHDTEVIRTIVENFQLVELPDEILNYFTEMLLSEDNGVKHVLASVLSTNSNPNIPSIIVPYISSPVIATRNLAGEVLLKRKGNSVKAMLDYLPQGDNDDKKFIIDLLGLIGDSRAIDEIINTLKVANDDNLVLACIEALGNLKAAKAVKDIMSVFEINELFRPTIIEALGKIGTPEAANFINLNYYGVDDLTKFSLIESLGNIGNVESFDTLLADLRYLEGPIKWVALEAIAKLQEKYNLELPPDDSLKTAILETFESGDVEYKNSAILLIDKFDGNDFLEQAFVLYGNDNEVDSKLKEYFFKRSAAVLSRIGNYLKTVPTNLISTLSLIKDIISHDEGSSLNTLTDIELRFFLDVLTTFLKNADEEVRGTTIELLFYIDPETAIVFSDLMIQDTNLWNRLKLLDIIQFSDDPRLIEILVELGNDEEEMVRETAQGILFDRGINNLQLKD